MNRRRRIPAVFGLAVPAPLQWRDDDVALGAPDAARGHFHLRHCRRAVVAAKPWRTPGQQLLRAQRADDGEFIGVEMRRASHHANVQEFNWGSSGEAMVRNPPDCGRLRTAGCQHCSTPERAAFGIPRSRAPAKLPEE
jgi:hypothetical protein